MTKKEIEDYQSKIKPWMEKHDVTMVDVVVSGYVDEVIYIVDDIILKMIASN